MLLPSCTRRACCQRVRNENCVWEVGGREEGQGGSDETRLVNLTNQHAQVRPMRVIKCRQEVQNTCQEGAHEQFHTVESVQLSTTQISHVTTKQLMWAGMSS